MNPDDPLSWIMKGDRDLTLVRDMLPNLATYPDLICYHCQQAAEKHLKALLVHYGQPVKRTHDLEELIEWQLTLPKPMFWKPPHVQSFFADLPPEYCVFNH